MTDVETEMALTDRNILHANHRALLGLRARTPIRVQLWDRTTRSCIPPMGAPTGRLDAPAHAFGVCPLRRLLHER